MYTWYLWLCSYESKLSVSKPYENVHQILDLSRTTKATNNRQVYLHQMFCGWPWGNKNFKICNNNWYENVRY